MRNLFLVTVGAITFFSFTPSHAALEYYNYYLIITCKNSDKQIKKMFSAYSDSEAQQLAQKYVNSDPATKGKQCLINSLINNSTGETIAPKAGQQIKPTQQAQPKTFDVTGYIKCDGDSQIRNERESFASSEFDGQAKVMEKMQNSTFYRGKNCVIIKWEKSLN